MLCCEYLNKSQALFSRPNTQKVSVHVQETAQGTPLPHPTDKHSFAAD